MRNKEPKSMVVVDTAILGELRLVADQRGTTMRRMVTDALKSFIKAETSRMAESNE